MRVRSLVSLAAGVAVLAGAGTIVALKVHGSNGPARHRAPPTITVFHLAARARHGVIASGTINGKAWRLRLTRKSSKYGPCSVPPGGWYADCTMQIGGRLDRWSDFRGPAAIWDQDPVFYGPVHAGVDRVSLRLSDGAVMILHPVEVFGHKWIGVVLPSGLGPVKAVAYSRDAELAHAVPFHDTKFRDYEFLTWLPPGDEGPSRMTKVIRGGGRTAVLHAGPWGNCLVDGYEGWSFSLDDHPSGALEGEGALPRTVAMAFPWPARYITLGMSDGTTRRIRLVQGAGLGFAFVRAPRRPTIDEWNVYNEKGQRLSGGYGAPGGI
jgi:hypothetical protein